MFENALNTSVKIRPAMLALFLFVPLLSLLSACGSEPPLTSYHFSGPTMGTSYNITLVLDEGQALPKEQKLIQSDIDRLLAEYNQIMSTYIPDSELMRFNAAPVNTSVALSPDLYEVFRISETIHQASYGSFDITVGPLVNAWGFGPGKSLDEVPSAEIIAEHLANIGTDNIQLNDGAASKASELFVDLSAVAKGYGADFIARYINELGVNNYLIEIGGEIRVAGVSSRKSLWRLGIERPSMLHENTQQTIQVADAGVATSGDYRNYFEKDGVRYSHTIDPVTGWPVKHNLASVTVVANTAAEADAWATALTVVGSDRALVLANENELAVFLILKSEAGFVESYNARFAPYLESSQ